MLQASQDVRPRSDGTHHFRKPGTKYCRIGADRLSDLAMRQSAEAARHGEKPLKLIYAARVPFLASFAGFRRALHRDDDLPPPSRTQPGGGRLKAHDHPKNTRRARRDSCDRRLNSRLRRRLVFPRPRDDRRITAFQLRYVDVFAIIGWLAIARDQWVRDAGDQYARALLANCDALPNAKAVAKPRSQNRSSASKL
jgi:hypothetical protein